MRLYVNPEHLNNAEVLAFVASGLVTEVAARRKKKASNVPDMEYQGDRVALVVDAYYLLAHIVHSRTCTPQDAEALKKWSSTIRSLQITTGMCLGYRELTEIADTLVKSGGYVPEVKEKAVQVGNELLMFTKQLDNAAQANDYSLIVSFKHVGSYLRNHDSASAWNNVVNFSNVVKDINVKKKFVKQHDRSQTTKLGEELQAGVLKLVNRKGYLLTYSEEVRLAADPKKAGALAIYKRSASEAVKLWNTQAKSMLRSSGKQHVPAVEFEAQMKKAGIPWSRVPTGYTGNIGLTKEGALSLFTPYGEAVEGWPLPGRPVTMNPEYTQGSSTYYIKAVDDKSNETKTAWKVGDRAVIKWDGRLNKVTVEKIDGKNVRVVFDNDGDYDDIPITDLKPLKSGGVNSYYTQGHTQRRESGKDETIRECIAAAPKIVARLQADIRKIDDNKKVLDKNDVTVLLVWMTWDTAARIGSLKNKNDGMSSLVINNVRLNSTDAGVSSIALKYSGKSDIGQNHITKFKTPVQKKAGKLLQKLITGKSKADFLWTYGIGQKRVTEKAANEYLKHIGFPSTAHKIRHVRGTMTAQEILDGQGKKPRLAKGMSLADKQRAVEAWFKKEVAEPVAVTLGHKKATGEPIWSTSVKSYIDKGWMREWFTNQGLKIPKWLMGKNAEG